MYIQFNNYEINESATDLRLNHLEIEASIKIKRKEEPPSYENKNILGFPLPLNNAANAIIIGSFADAKAVQHFLQLRLLSKSTGYNWYLLEYEDFGQDMRYQIEVNSYRRLDMLNTFDVVYPRFRSENTFIQPRLLAKSAQIFDWLQNGAYLYVGTLAYPIEETLLRLIQKEARATRKEAVDYLEDLKKQRRFEKYIAAI